MDVFLESSNGETHIYWENEMGDSCGNTYELTEAQQPMSEV